MKRRPTLPLLFLLPLLLSAALAAEQQIDQTRSAAPDVAVEVELLSGSLRVIGWDRAEVAITGTVGDDAELDISGDDEEIEIEIEIDEDEWRGGYKAGADLEIRMPHGGNLEVESLSATVVVSQLSGRLEIESMSGDVTVEGDAASVEVETVSGAIEIKGAASRVDAASVSGRVLLDGMSGDVEASSVNGNLEITAGEIDRANFETVNGTVLFRGRLGTEARLSVESYSGNVTLELPADTAAAVDIESFSGQIENALGSGAEAERTSRGAPGKRLKFTLGSGGARIRVETFSGNVVLRP